MTSQGRGGGVLPREEGGGLLIKPAWLGSSGSDSPPVSVLADGSLQLSE